MHCLLVMICLLTIIYFFLTQIFLTDSSSYRPWIVGYPFFGQILVINVAPTNYPPIIYSLIPTYRLVMSLLKCLWIFFECICSLVRSSRPRPHQQNLVCLGDATQGHNLNNRWLNPLGKVKKSKWVCGKKSECLLSMT